MWEIDLATPGDVSPGLYALLSVEERERATRFRFPELRRRWTRSRAALRCILGRYTGDSPPEDLAFRLGPFGKPELIPPSGGRAPNFNLTHSRDLALLAVAPDAVGIDSEFVNPDLAWEPLTEQVFTERERSQLRQRHAAHQLRMFFELWTRKEAYIKGRGLGLSLPLKSFSVPVDDADEIGRIDVDAEWNDRREWRLYRVPIERGTHAATLSYADTVPNATPFRVASIGRRPVRAHPVRK